MKNLLCAFPVIFLGAVSAHSAALTVYSVEDSGGEFKGLLLDKGSLYINFGAATKSGLIDKTMHQKVIKFGLKGGKGCKNYEQVDVGVNWRTQSCVTVNRAGSNAWSITIHSKYYFHNGSRNPKLGLGENPDPGELSVLKGYNFVKERKRRYSFSLEGNGCKSYREENEYVPLDGSSFISAWTGRISCKKS